MRETATPPHIHKMAASSPHLHKMATASPSPGPLALPLAAGSGGSRGRQTEAHKPPWGLRPPLSGARSMLWHHSQAPPLSGLSRCAAASSPLQRGQAASNHRSSCAKPSRPPCRAWRPVLLCAFDTTPRTLFMIFSCLLWFNTPNVWILFVTFFIATGGVPQRRQLVEQRPRGLTKCSGECAGKTVEIGGEGKLSTRSWIRLFRQPPAAGLSANQRSDTTMTFGWQQAGPQGEPACKQRKKSLAFCFAEAERGRAHLLPATVQTLAPTSGVANNKLN